MARHQLTRWARSENSCRTVAVSATAVDPSGDDMVVGICVMMASSTTFWHVDKRFGNIVARPVGSLTNELRACILVASEDGVVPVVAG